MQPPESISEAKIWAAVIGACGAAVSLTFIKDLTWPQKLVMVVCGTVISVLFTEPIIDLVDVPPTWSNGVAFLVGMFGWSLAGSVLSMIRKADWWELVKEIALSWLKRRGG